MTTPTHITTSGGLISAAFIKNVREPGPASAGPSRCRLPSVRLRSPQGPGHRSPKSPAALEETIAVMNSWRHLGACLITFRMV